MKTQTLHLNTFGGNLFQKHGCELVGLQLKNHVGEETEITSLSYPTICSPLPSKVKVNYPHLEGLALADSLDDSCGDIDVGIGSDYFWDLVRVKRFEAILVQQQSHPCLARFYLVLCVTP